MKNFRIRTYYKRINTIGDDCISKRPTIRLKQSNKRRNKKRQNLFIYNKVLKKN